MEESQFISIEHDIDDIIKTCKLFRFQLELSHINDSNKETQLRKIISDLDNVCIKKDETLQLKTIITSFSDKVYNQSWNKLKSFHKEDRLTKYIDSKYEKHKDKSTILKLVINGLNEGLFNKTASVEYDAKTAKIISIPILNESEGSFSLKKKLK